MTTRMGAAAGGAVTKPPMSRFAAALAGARVFRLIVIPGLNVAADMTVVGHDQVQLIDGEVMVAMAELKIGPPTTLTAWSYEAERAARTLARACFDPEARAKGALVPVGTVEEWCAIPDEWLDPVWLAYKQLRAEVSPYGNEGITDEEVGAILAAVKKKDRTSLRSFGLEKLIDWATTMVDRLSPSSTSTSGDGASSPDS